MKARNSKSKIPLILPIYLCLCLSFAASPAYGDSIASVEKLFLEGQYDKVVAETNRLIDGKAARRDRLYYIKGLSELKLKRFDDARRSFEDVISGYTGSKLLFDAHLGIGDSYLLEGKIDAAISIYDDMAKRFSGNRNIAIVYYRLAEGSLKTGSTDRADHYKREAGKVSALSFEARSGLLSEAGDLGTPSGRQNFAAKEIPESESKGYASVQVGSFKNKKNAERLSARLAKDGYKGFVEIPDSSGKKLYRVKAGKFKSKAEADDLASRLKKDGYRTSIDAGSI